MVIQPLVHQLNAAGRHSVPVQIQDKREDVNAVVPHHSGHGHIVYVGFLLVPEQKELCNLGELLAVLEVEVIAGNLEDAVHGRNHQIHVGVYLGGGGKLAVKVSVKACEHGHESVHRGEQGYNFLCRDIHKVKVKSGRQVLLVPRGVEALEIEVSHV